MNTQIEKKHVFLLGLTTYFMLSSAMASDVRFHPSVALQGGYTSITANSHSENFTDSESNVFLYRSSNHAKDSGFLGGFLGVEYALPGYLPAGYFLQTGLEYNYFGNVGIHGQHWVGVTPDTSTAYQYHYTAQSQQVLSIIKLFATLHERFHPYAEIGLGAAFNHAYSYHAATSETGNINLTQVFPDRNKAQFSYALGVGVEADLTKHVRMGLGYRFSGLGTADLGAGDIVFNHYQSSSGFSLGGGQMHANQVFLRMSYTV
ncbi:MAG: acyloxyacyl hydrolase [Gammaproteobacteria bacterium]|nr:acyloxyacyl hydrolase [Gammaproteobacteria bacterium]